MGLLKDAFGRLFGATPATPGGKAAPTRKAAAEGGKEGGRSKPGLAAKKGRKAAVGQKSKTPEPAAGSTARDKALAQVRAAQGTVVTEGRAELIREAMKIRQAKQQILADLSDDQRARLAALAIRGLLNEGRDEPKN